MNYIKSVCDLISLATNAVATNTIDEAIQYLEEHPSEEIVAHTLNLHTISILTEIKNKQTI